MKFQHSEMYNKCIHGDKEARKGERQSLTGPNEVE